MTGPAILFVPGLRDHVADHWQTLLQERLPGSRCVPRRQHDKLSCALWVEDLDREIRSAGGPVLLVAHSGGVAIVAHWAARHAGPIHGALLAAPPDFDSPLPAGYPTQEALRVNGWMPVPMTRLPFPSIVAASTNDPLARLGRVEAMAAAWGSRLVNVGAVGHLNPASGFGEWPRAQELIRELA